MELQTERLTLRPFFPEDGEHLFEYLSDPEVVKYEPYEPCDRESAYIQAAWRGMQNDFIAVVLKPPHGGVGKLIGNLYLGKRDFFTYELGFVFNRSYWRMGYAKEASTAALNYIFSDLGAHRVFAQCVPENENSRHLLESLGFRREAHLHLNSFYKRDGTGAPIWQDTYIYAILQDEWFGLHNL